MHPSHYASSAPVRVGDPSLTDCPAPVRLTSPDDADALSLFPAHHSVHSAQSAAATAGGGGGGGSGNALPGLRQAVALWDESVSSDISHLSVAAATATSNSININNNNAALSAQSCQPAPATATATVSTHDVAPLDDEDGRARYLNERLIAYGYPPLPLLAPPAASDRAAVITGVAAVLGDRVKALRRCAEVCHIYALMKERNYIFICANTLFN